MTATWEGSRVYLVDDPTSSRDALASGLAEQGFYVSLFDDADSFERAAVAAPCDFAIIDILLDPQGGHGIVMQLRSRARNMGIVVHSAITCLETRLQCLESGADAYLVKPVEARELAAQLRVLGRRLRGASGVSDILDDWALIEGGWSLRDPAGHKLSLTTAERVFLHCLFERAGQPVPRGELLTSLGADPRQADPHRLDVLVNRLRAKAQALQVSLPVRAVRGRGYVLAVSGKAVRAEGRGEEDVMPVARHDGGMLDCSYPTWE